MSNNVTRMCENKAHCDLTASDDIFGIPFVSENTVMRYLEVAFQCDAGKYYVELQQEKLWILSVAQQGGVVGLKGL